MPLLWVTHGLALDASRQQTSSESEVRGARGASDAGVAENEPAAKRDSGGDAAAASTQGAPREAADEPLLRHPEAGVSDAGLQLADGDAGELPEAGDEAHGASHVPAALAGVRPAVVPEASAGDAANDWELGWGEVNEGAGLEAETTSDDVGFVPLEAGHVAAARASTGELSLSVALLQRVGIWTRRAGLAQALHRAGVSLEYVDDDAFDVAGLKGELVGAARWDYDARYSLAPYRRQRAAREAYEYQQVPGEIFGRLGTDTWRIAIGRQVIARGKGLILSPADKLSPRDERYVAFELPSEQRLPTWSLRAGAFVGAHRFEVVAAAEWSFGLRPPPLGEYSPLGDLLEQELGRDGQVPTVYWEHAPSSFRPRQTQVAGWWQYDGAGVDLGLIAGSTLDQQGVPGPADSGGPGSNSLVLELAHPRYEWFGAQGALPVMTALALHWELIVELGRPLTTFAEGPPLEVAWSRRDWVNAMFGVTYTGLRNASIVLEASRGLLLDDGAGQELAYSPELSTIAVLYNQSAWHENLTLSAVALVFGFDGFVAALARAQVEYRVTDRLRVGLGYVAFMPSDNRYNPLFGMRRRDQLFSLLSYAFTLP